MKESRIIMVHIRATLENTSTLCGADPREGSQSLEGICHQATMPWDRIKPTFPRPNRLDYCDKCIAILDSALPAFCSLTHMPISECID
jgi:hypothetical protein